jgi:hypothetical protein
MRSSNTASRQSDDRRAAALRQMTADQLLDLGTRQVVYLRAGTYDGERLFVLYAADGELLAMVDDVEAAVEVAAEHDLEFVAVH